MKAGDKLTIPIKAIWRSEFAGTSIKLKAFGEGFEGVKELDVPLKATGMEAVLDFATLKTPPGEYTLAFYGPAVIKYRHNPDAAKTAEQEQKKAEQEALAIAEAAKKLADEAKAAPTEKKTEADKRGESRSGKTESSGSGENQRSRSHEGRDRRRDAEGHRGDCGVGTDPDSHQARRQEMRSHRDEEHRLPACAARGLPARSKRLTIRVRLHRAAFGRLEARRPHRLEACVPRCVPRPADGEERGA